MCYKREIYYDAGVVNTLPNPDHLNSTMAQNFEDQNVTTSSTSEPTSELHPYGVLVFAACAWVIVAVLGITGNAMVILAAILSKHVRTTTNVLVVNLSVADLWTCLSLPWSSVALLSNGTWPLASEIPCQIAAFMWHTGLGVSLYNLAFIALNRLVKITCRLATYNRIFSPRKMAYIVALSWFIPIFVIIFPLTIGVGSLGLDLRDDTCTDDDLHPRADDYNLAQTIGFYPIPMITVVVSYVVIYIHVRRHFSKQLSKTQNKDTATDAVQPSATSMTSISTTGTSAEVLEEREERKGAARKRKISRQQLQITKNLFWVFCAFTLCISPYYISLFFANSDVFALYGATILICNSCVNPIIYGVKHPQFKKVLRPMLWCKWKKIPQPSETLQAILSIRQRDNT
ncbi:G-protein coupled receptor moody-like [Patiria miniata]|uniref:G-protein coupled receptors family 1 profile domain-containing protein n=1 Tax=Patiria miniata TaxID=46514 RepID=A0A913ZHN8_PATMI|nr:G-protein coupled receptor moody-like [Patiria miniata]